MSWSSAASGRWFCCFNGFCPYDDRFFSTLVRLEGLECFAISLPINGFFGSTDSTLVRLEAIKSTSSRKTLALVLIPHWFD